MVFRSNIVENVRIFVAAQPAGSKAAEDRPVDYLKAAQKLGYGEPFDLEQKAINDLLCEARADEYVCLSVWAYYHDMKLNRAYVEADRRYAS